MRKFYVYGFVRSDDSINGPRGSFYYMGKGYGHRMYSRQRLCPRPRDPSHIVVLGEGLYEVDALQAEILLIHLYGRVDLGTGCLRNLTNGGEGSTGYAMPDDVKQKHSLSMKGRKFSAEHRAKLSEAKRGTVLPTEHREKLSAALKGKPKSDEHRAKMSSSQRGRCFSQEHRKSISSAQIGRKRGPMSQEQKEKLSAAMKGHQVSPETRAKISLSLRLQTTTRHLTKTDV